MKKKRQKKKKVIELNLGLSIQYVCVIITLLLVLCPYIHPIPRPQDPFSSPQPFLAPGTDFVEDNFSTHQRGGNSFRMIQDHYIYCALYLYYYYISPTSGHQALDPEGWGTLAPL